MTDPVDTMHPTPPRPCLLTRLSLVIVLAAGIALGGLTPARSGPNPLPPSAPELGH